MVPLSAANSGANREQGRLENRHQHRSHTHAKRGKHHPPCSISTREKVCRKVKTPPPTKKFTRAAISKKIHKHFPAINLKQELHCRTILSYSSASEKGFYFRTEVSIDRGTEVALNARLPFCGQELSMPGHSPLLAQGTGS